MAGTLLLQGKARHDRHLSGRRTAPGRPQQRSPPAGRRHLRHDRCLGCPRGGGAHLQTVPLAIAVVVTLLVYWAAEGYAELLSEQIHGGHLPNGGIGGNRCAAGGPRLAAGRAAQLRGPRLLLVTLIAGAFGVVMILLKLVVTH
jgi:hypothetical protein